MIPDSRLMENKWELEDLDRLTRIEEAFGWRASQHVIGPMRKELLRLERLSGALQEGAPVSPDLMRKIHQQIDEDLNASERRVSRVSNFLYGTMLSVLLVLALRGMPISVPPAHPLAVLLVAVVLGVLIARRRIKSHRLW